MVTVPSQRHDATPTDFAAAWKERRRRKRLRLWVPLGGLLVVFGFSRIPGLAWTASPMLAVLAVASLVLALRSARWRCPRCGEVFQVSPNFSNTFTRTCLNCGLPVNAPGTDPDERRPR